MINIGVIGYGYWGPNIVRNFNAIEYGCVKSVCDLRPQALERVQKNFPAISTTSDFHEILSNPELDAIAVITPVATHFPLVKQALENGKHVFVEKPFTQTAAQAEELINLAEQKHLKIMVDHTFLFTPAVRKIKELIAIGVAHTTQCPYCIESHVKAAQKAGATAKEIAEAIFVAAALRAGGAFAHSTIAMGTLKGTEGK